MRISFPSQGTFSQGRLGLRAPGALSRQTAPPDISTLFDYYNWLSSQPNLNLLYSIAAILVMFKFQKSIPENSVTSFYFQINEQKIFIQCIPLQKFITKLKKSMSSSLISLINAARTNPDRIIASMYSDLKPMYKGTIMNAYGKKIQTFEGVKALDDLKKFMEAVPATGSLVQSPSLYKAAMSIALQKGSKGETNHQKPRVINEKVQASSNMTGKVGELICLGTSSAEQALTYFLIDDGLMSRKRRRMLFDPAYNYIGVGTAAHATYGTIAVILLAQKIAQ